MKATEPKRTSLTDGLRRAIQEAGVSYNELRRMAGVNQAQVSRFMLGERDLTLQVASRLCLFLGYELVKTGECMTEPLTERPTSTRTRPAGAKKPKSVVERGQGRRVDLEILETAEVDFKKPRRRPSKKVKGT